MPQSRVRPNPLQAMVGGFVSGVGQGMGMYPQIQQKRLEQEKKGKEEELTALVKAADLLKKHPAIDDEHPLVLQNIVDRYKLITGVDLGGGTPQRMGRMPFPAPGGGAFRTPTAIEGSGDVARQEMTALAKAGEERMKPSQGLRDRYKNLGTQMVKQAENINGLKKLIPEKGKKQIRYAEMQVSRAEQEMERLQGLYDRVRANAAGSGVTLEPNTWDIHSATAQQPSVAPTINLMTKEQFVQDFNREEGREPTERDLQMLKGIAWE